MRWYRCRAPLGYWSARHRKFGPLVGFIVGGGENRDTFQPWKWVVVPPNESFDTGFPIAWGKSTSERGAKKATERAIAKLADQIIRSLREPARRGSRADRWVR